MILRLITALVFTWTAAAQSFPIADARVGPAPGDREWLHAAATNEQFLVVWADTRAGWAEDSDKRVLATRVRRNGEVLDPTGIPVGEIIPYREDVLQCLQAVATDGTDFLIATHNRETLHLTKVTSEGVATAIELPPTPVETARLAWLGDAYLLTYTLSSSSYSPDPRAFAMLLDRNGAILVPPFVLVTAANRISELNAIVTGANSVLLAWVDRGDRRVHVQLSSIAGLRAGVARHVSTPAGVSDAIAPKQLSLATSGERHLLTWYEGNKVRGRFLDASARPVSSVLNLDWASEWTPWAPVVAEWDGDEFVVASSVRAGEGLNASLHVLDEQGLSRRVDGFSPTIGMSYPGYGQVALVSHGGISLVAWASARTSELPAQLFVNVLDASLHPRNEQPILVSRAPSTREDPEVVWMGTQYLAAWVEHGETNRVMLGRISPTGRRLDGTGRVGVSDAGRDDIALATDGRDALLVTSPYLQGPQASIVKPDGSVLPPVPLGGHVAWDAIFDGTNYLVCTGLELIRLSREGTVIRKVPVPRGIGPCSIEWTGDHYVVSSFDYFIGQEIGAALVVIFGANLDPISVIELGSADSDVSGRYRRTSALLGDRVLTVWSTRGGELRGARIQSGANLDGPDGFLITPAGAAPAREVFVENGMWVVTSGPYAWTVLRSGQVTPRETRFPFVAEGTETRVVFGGPRPLLVYGKAPGELQQQLYGRFLGAAGRGRAVRH